MDVSSSPSVQKLQEENERLRRAIEELSILNDLARVIGASLNSQEIMQSVIHKALRAVHAEQGVITLVEKESTRSMKTLVRSMVTSSDHPRFHFHQSLLGWMELNKKPLVINDPKSDERFRGLQWDPGIHNVLSVPLMVKAELTGILCVFNKKDSAQFNIDNQRLLAIMAAQSAQIVENARLYEQEKALLRVQEEMRMASTIQQDLLPKSPPKLDGFDIAGITVSARSVGGDFFDFIALGGGRLGICLGDVSGKGMPAAMLMAHIHATVQAQAKLHPVAHDAIGGMNELLCQSLSSKKFATMVYAILCPSENTLTYCNAGHDFPILFSSDAKVTPLKNGGIPLGMFTPFGYESGVVHMVPGDVLVIYSDGIAEAWNASDVAFGEQKIRDVIHDHLDKPAEVIIDQLLKAVEHHTVSMPQADDMTVVVIKKL